MNKNRCSQILKTLTFLSLLICFALIKPPTGFAQSAPQCYYNACTDSGPVCNLGCQFYSPGDYVVDSYMEFYTEELKYVPHPYWEEYKDYTCLMSDCTSSALSNTWYCSSEIDGDTPATINCDQMDTCSLSQINAGSGSCNIDAVRWSNGGVYLLQGWYTCLRSGWARVGSGNSGCCWPTSEPVCSCTGGTYDALNSGTWECNDCYADTYASLCEDMLDTYTIGMSPGYIQTRTPYLFDIWSNIVAKTQNIFSLFRTDFNPPEDWPGDTTISYTFSPNQGEGWADAGSPDSMHPGYDARIYFRYLGYIHCVKENVLHKLTSYINTDQPYVYYDSRCDTGAGGSNTPPEDGDGDVTFNCTDDFETLFDGITYKQQAAQSPRTLSIHIVKVDFAATDSDLFITPESGVGSTTSQFLGNYDLQVAINGDVTDPSNGGPMGLAADRGNIYHNVIPHEIVAYGSATNQITMYDEPATIWNAISGQNALVLDGAMHPRIASCAEPENYCQNLEPRTAIGVTSNNTLIMMVIDGRQAGLSLGVTLHELADMMLQCNAQDAINLDGGGSTTLVIQDRGVVNSPSEGTERSIPNHLGIHPPNP